MSEAAPAPETSPLEERLIALIKAHGPITVADYMEDALLHPHDGYYTSQTPIGAEGDFTTAPEISQIFGELVGLWLVHAWAEIGSPKSFNLIEFGPGRGVLMQDILRAAQLRSDFLDAAHIWMIETSGRLRHEQQKRLRNIGPLLDWADSFADVPPGPALIVANEFFDCLPIRQFVRAGNGWRERLVTVEDGALVFTLSQTPPLPGIPLPDPSAVEEGEIFEVSEAAEAMAEEIANALVEHGGRALILDYGHIHSGCGDTLQAVRNHKYWPVLTAPGKADITAHVNFERLVRAAFATGAAAHGPVSQGAFLERLGLSLRVEKLSAGKQPDQAAEIHAGAHRIAAPSQMGELFKVVCLSAPGLPLPAGFTQ